MQINRLWAGGCRLFNPGRATYGTSRIAIVYASQRTVAHQPAIHSSDRKDDNRRRWGVLFGGVAGGAGMAWLCWSKIERQERPNHEDGEPLLAIRGQERYSRRMTPGTFAGVQLQFPGLSQHFIGTDPGDLWRTLQIGASLFGALGVLGAFGWWFLHSRVDDALLHQRPVDYDKLDESFKRIEGLELAQLREHHSKLHMATEQEREEPLRQLGKNWRRWLVKAGTTVVRSPDQQVPLARCWLAALATLPFENKEIGRYAAHCLWEACQVEIQDEEVEKLKAMASRLGLFFGNNDLAAYSDDHLILLAKSYALVLEKIATYSSKRPEAIDRLERGQIAKQTHALLAYGKGIPEFQYQAQRVRMAAKSIESDGGALSACIAAIVRVVESSHNNPVAAAMASAVVGGIPGDQKAVETLYSSDFNTVKSYIERMIDPLVALAQPRAMTDVEIRYLQAMTVGATEDESCLLKMVEMSRSSPVEEWVIGYAAVEAMEVFQLKQDRLKPQLIRSLRELVREETPWQVRYRVDQALMRLQDRFPDHYSISQAMALSRKSPYHSPVGHPPSELWSRSHRTARGLLFAHGPEECMDILPPEKHFVGRSEDLKQVARHLHDGSALVVWGAGGIGKTHLARAYVQQYGSEYERIFRIRAIAGSLDASLDPLMNQLNISQEMEPELRFDELRRDLESGPPTLLFVDNVDDADLARDLATKLPLHRWNVHLLITSKLGPATQAAFKAADHRLGSLSIDDATGYLVDVAGVSEPADCATAREIAKKLGCHPLSLSHAAYYLRQNRFLTLQEYSEHLERGMARILAQPIVPPDDDYPSSVQATWQLSFDAIEASGKKRGVKSVELLAFLATLGCDRIPRSLLVDWAREVHKMDDLELTAALGPLADYSFVERTKEGYSLHPVVHAIVRASKTALSDWRIGLDLLNRRLSSFDKDRPETWDLGRGLFSHGLEQLRFGATESQALLSPDGAVLLRRMGEVLITEERFDEAMDLFNRAFAIQATVYGEGDHREIAITLNELGSAMLRKKRIPESKKVLTQAFEMKSRLYPDQFHDEIAKALINLGNVYMEETNFPESVHYYERALEILDKTKTKVPLTTKTHINLGHVLCMLERYPESEAHYRRALAGLRECEADRHYSLLYAMASVGLAGTLAARESTQYVEQKELLMSAVGVYSKIYGKKNHLQLVDLYQKLADLCDKQNLTVEARRFRLDAVETALRCRLEREDAAALRK